MTVYDYRISTGATVTTGTGWLNASVNSTTIIGTSGTAFSTQLHAGDLLIVGATYIGPILSIADNTHLTLQHGCPIVLSNNAFTFDPMVNVETLDSGKMTAPKGDYQPWAMSVPTGDGLARGLGRPVAQWRWNAGAQDYLTVSSRDALRAYCTGKSARVFIRTRTFETTDSFATFQAAMIWPDKEERDFLGVRRGFMIEFRDLLAL